MNADGSRSRMTYDFRGNVTRTVVDTTGLALTIAWIGDWKEIDIAPLAQLKHPKLAKEWTLRMETKDGPVSKSAEE